MYFLKNDEEEKSKSNYTIPLLLKTLFSKGLLYGRLQNFVMMIHD